jgi:rhodanese-like protein
MGIKQTIALLLTATTAVSAADIPNRLIDYPRFQTQVNLVGELRGSHRVTEEEFIRMAGDSATVILDARSAEKFALLHVRGARNLSLPDITAAELEKVIPSKSTRVLIYCNNNFLHQPLAFPSKLPSASLNVHTMSVLYAYGYMNVYELGPLIDFENAKLEFDGTLAARKGV